MGAFTAINPDHRFSDSLPWPHCSLTCHHCLNQSTLCVCVCIWQWMRIRVDENDCFGFINYWTRTCTTAHVSRLLLVSSVQHLHWSHLTSPCWQTDRFCFGFFCCCCCLLGGGQTLPPPHLLFTGWTIHPPCLKASFPSFYSGGYAITQTNTLCQTNSPDFRLIFTYLFHTLNCWSLQSLALARSHMVIYIYHVHTYTHKQTYLIASLQT